jgi:hypothetical protein
MKFTPMRIAVAVTASLLSLLAQANPYIGKDVKLSGPTTVGSGSFGVQADFDGSTNPHPADAGSFWATPQQFTFSTSGILPVTNAAPIAEGTKAWLFCIELDEQSGGTTKYTFESVAGALNTRPPPSSLAFGATREENLRRLYDVVFMTYDGNGDPSNNSYYNVDPNALPVVPASFGGGTNLERLYAFQLAVWELTYEDTGSGAWTIASGGGANGSFLVNSGNTTIRGIANTMLNSARTYTRTPTVSLLALTHVNPLDTNPFDGSPRGVQDMIMPFFATGSNVLVPEPSTYALLFGVATLGFVSIRRRLRKQVT